MARPRPGSGGGTGATCSSNDCAILLTCDFESELMPRVFTNLSMRPVETPAR